MGVTICISMESHGAGIVAEILFCFWRAGGSKKDCSE